MCLKLSHSEPFGQDLGLDWQSQRKGTSQIFRNPADYKECKNLDTEFQSIYLRFWTLILLKHEHYINIIYIWYLNYKMKKILNWFVFYKISQFRKLFISLRKLILLNLGRVLFYFILFLPTIPLFSFIKSS